MRFSKCFLVGCCLWIFGRLLAFLGSPMLIIGELARSRTGYAGGDRDGGGEERETAAIQAKIAQNTLRGTRERSTKLKALKNAAMFHYSGRWREIHFLNSFFKKLNFSGIFPRKKAHRKKRQQRSRLRYGEKFMKQKSIKSLLWKHGELGSLWERGGESRIRFYAGVVESEMKYTFFKSMTREALLKSGRREWLQIKVSFSTARLTRFPFPLRCCFFPAFSTRVYLGSWYRCRRRRWFHVQP